MVRKIIFWCHLTAGVAVGIVVLIMSVTGVALTYQRQMQHWADAGAFRVSSPRDGVPPLRPSLLVEALRRVDPELTPSSITWRRDPKEPVAIVADNRTLYLNPYTGEVYGEGRGQRMRAFMSTMTSWHRYLGRSGNSRSAGRIITGACNLAFLFLVVSGFYLWWPRTWTWIRFKNVLWFRRQLPSKARDFNWHHVIGFWSAAPLAVVVFSGVVISYPWAGNLVYRVMGEAPPGPAAARSAGERAATRAVPTAWAGTDPDVLYARAAAFDPEWRVLSMRWPTSNSPVTFTIDRGSGGQPQLRSTLVLDAKTASVTRWDAFSNQTPGRRARSWLRFFHTGEAGGLAGQTIAGLVSAGAAVLVYTGFALSFRRFFGRRARRSGESPISQ
jgi:uncharacterized iron-regulated membrane protein